MKELFLSKDIRQLEDETMSRNEWDVDVLMERAAAAVCDEIHGRHKHPCVERVLVVCGPGKNGGDGLAIARILCEYGFDVDYCLFREPQEHTATFRQWKRLDGLAIRRVPEPSKGYTIIVDALLGTGGNRAIEGELLYWVECINALPRETTRVYSVDLPSGVYADTGKVDSTAVRANVTIVLGRYKVGCYFYPGTTYCGELVYASAGLFPESKSFLPAWQYYEYTDIAKCKERKKDGHKGTFGKVLVVAGRSETAGAAYLSVASAARSGSGMVHLFTKKDVRNLILHKLPEAMITERDGFCKEEEETLLSLLCWANVILAGPGMGKGQEERDILRVLLQHAKVPMVWDADALTLLASDSELSCLAMEYSYGLILTPHRKEMEAILGKQDDEQDYFERVRAYAIENPGFYIVAKDARTVAIHDGDIAAVFGTGNHGMATAGSGDVLAGIVASHAGYQEDLSMACKMAILIHGHCGDLACQKLGAHYLLAEDIVEQLQEISRELNV